MRTRVAIIGGGPSGMLLGQLLHRHGIDTVIVERHSREHVLGRIRAGVLETGTVNLMRQAGVAGRLDTEGFIHRGAVIAYDDRQFRIDFDRHTGNSVVVYGQTELTRDLYDARDKTGAPMVFEAADVTIHDVDSATPSVTCDAGGRALRIDCEFVAGCDGFHGVSRRAIPDDIRRDYERIYPFGWLGVLSETPPVNDEIIYASSDRGFALCSMRNANLSRYYIQCDLSDSPGNWSDDAFWDELRRRIPPSCADRLITGPAVEKSIAPLRSFVTEPMRWGRLFLCGDAAHIVPPTGAKGLNTAASDVHYLHTALCRYFDDADEQGLEAYSATALARIWKAERFSWATTNMLHRFPDQSGFDRRMQRAEIDFLRENDAAQAAFAQNYVGLPY